MSEQKKLKITLVRSTNKKLKDHKATVKGLGLRKIDDTVELLNTPEIRGMTQKVGYLLKVEEL